MCGISGVVGSPPPERHTLERMAAVMAHRGPDGQGTWHDGEAGFGFRRLAIIDLDKRSDQPMHLGPLHLVFNGEIYNYRELRHELEGRGHQFATEGDTEVLLHAWHEWGEWALGRLNGMFAFAVWDQRTRRLTIAADPFGEKPLYFHRNSGRLVFGSDIRAIMEACKDLGAPDVPAVAAFLVRGVMPAVERSFFEAVERLPGGHLLRWEAGRLELERWWSPQVTDSPQSYPDAVAELRELLRDSIRLRLRSDVPVGTSLSGGVDSSAVLALSTELPGEHARHAFTARFAGFSKDEWRYASATARAAGVIEHHAVEPNQFELLDDLEALVRDQEEPVGSSSVYAQWRVMRAAKEAGVTVLLDGQGSDELFAGYDGIAGYALRAGGGCRALHALGQPVEARQVLRSLAVERFPSAIARLHRRRASSPYVARELVSPMARVEPIPPRLASGWDPLRRELALQAFTTSLPQLLRYADRSSMAHSREVRLPFLDQRVAHFAFSLPPEYLYEAGTTKRVVRDAVRHLVPAETLERREKVGFETPQERWLNSPPARERVAEVLLDDQARARGLYDIAALELDFRAGQWRDTGALWRALNLELWLAARAPATTPDPALAA